MKNNCTPVADSDDSSKLLNDEKSDTRSLDDTGMPPPYSAPNKFIDLEMAGGSAQHSAQESTNNTGSDSTDSKWHLAAIFFFFASFVCFITSSIFLVVFFYFKVPVRASVLWGLPFVCPGSFVVFLFTMTQIPKEWFSQAGIVLSNMCVAVIYTPLVDVPCFAVYYVAKKTIGFEKMNDYFFYIVCAINVAWFVYLTSISYKLRGILDALVPDARQLRIFIADLGNGIGNGIRDAANYFRPTDLENEAPRNEEIELQPLAVQSVEA